MSKLCLTNSMIGGFKVCMRHGYLTYKEKLTPKAKALPLRRGSAVHAFLEEFYKGETNPKRLSTIALKEFHKGLAEATPYMNDKEIAATKKEECVVAGLSYGYTDHYADDLENWEIIGTEIPVELEIVNPDTGETHPFWNYRVTLDMVIREKETGIYRLVEHKTASQLGEMYWEKLEMDPQITGYWLACHAIGYPVQSVEYNVIKMPGIRQKKTETPEDFYARLEDEMVSDPDKYYHRNAIIKSHGQLALFMRGLWGWANLIQEWWDKPQEEWLRADVGMCTMYNRLCSNWEVCKFGLEGPHMLSYRRREVFHPEHEEEVQ